MAAIFYVSSLPAPEVPLPPGADDRLLHFVAYFGFGLTLVYSATAFWSDSLAQPHFVAAAVVGVLYGASDEWHQSFVPLRTAAVADFLADAAGVITAVAMAAVVHHRLRRA